MALVPKIGNVYVGNNCSSLFISEGTGIYDVTLNPGGYGTPNIDVDDVTETQIIITTGETSIVIENPVGLPTNDTQIYYEITADDLGDSSGKISDGLYRIEYTVSDGTTTYTTNQIQFLFVCNIKCCIDKMFAKIATDPSCSCNNVYIKNAQYAEALYKGLVANGECANPTNINTLITKLKAICTLSESNCGCGN